MKIDALMYLTDAVFYIDILVNFFTSFINVSTGDEIYGHGMIAENYIYNGPFLIDLISTLPLDKIFSDSTVAKVFGILKIQRIRRISKIIGQLNQTQETKAFLKVALMVFFLILYIHILACILWFTFTIPIDGTKEVWIPEADFIYAETKLFRESFSKQYLSMCYHAIMVFGINEVAPIRDNEVIVVVIMMVVSAMANAYIFGEMAVLV